MSRGLFTRFMDNTGLPGTGALLDYGLIDDDHVNTVTSFVIDEQARYDCGSDHALLIAKLVFGAKNSTSWSFHEVIHFDVHDDSDYSGYQTNLDQLSAAIPLHTFDTLPADQMLPHITHCIKESGKRNFGLKIKKKKKGKKLPKHLINKIKVKNELSRSLQHAHLRHQPTHALQDQINALKDDIRDTLSDLKLQRRHHIRSKTLRADPSRKKFWRFLKNQTKLAGNITGAYDVEGKMVFQQDDIEKAILDHFGKAFLGQRIPVYANQENNDHVSLSISDLENLINSDQLEIPEDKFESQVCSPYTFIELERVLSRLPSGKSSGYDQIPNELLKNSSYSFKMYLYSFLNKILIDGKVPQELNIGKCMLIHKVIVF